MERKPADGHSQCQYGYGGDVDVFIGRKGEEGERFGKVTDAPRSEKKCMVFMEML